MYVALSAPIIGPDIALHVGFGEIDDASCRAIPLSDVRGASFASSNGMRTRNIGRSRGSGELKVSTDGGSVFSIEFKVGPRSLSELPGYNFSTLGAPKLPPFPSPCPQGLGIKSRRGLDVFSSALVNSLAGQTADALEVWMSSLYALCAIGIECCNFKCQPNSMTCISIRLDFDNVHWHLGYSSRNRAPMILGAGVELEVMVMFNAKIRTCQCLRLLVF